MNNSNRNEKKLIHCEYYYHWIMNNSQKREREKEKETFRHPQIKYKHTQFFIREYKKMIIIRLTSAGFR